MNRLVMKIKQHISIVLLAAVVASISSCKKTLEWYVGLPMQPKNESAVYEPGLNVFGIIKNGPSLDTINHYFEVQQILPLNDTVSLMTIDEAEVTLWCPAQGAKEYELGLVEEGRYSDSLILLLPGQEWFYSCKYGNFEVTASSIIPQTPKVISGSIILESKELSFSIEADTTAFIYDVYFISNIGAQYKRIVPEIGKNSNVKLDITNRKGKVFNDLYVFAYDKNYERYVSTSNIFFKPNAFRPRFSTVEGGYGCFCSVSSCKVELAGF